MKMLSISSSVTGSFSSGGSFKGNSVKVAKQRVSETRVNRKIRALEVRVISDFGEQLGVIKTRDALQKAEAIGLDLVEVSPMARPPVCKIMDYGKFKYQQKRKATEAKRKQQNVELKEVKFRPKTDVHDFEVKVNRLKKFLSQGNKVKITIMFRGREIVHPNIGKDILQKITIFLGDNIIIDTQAKMEGRQMIMIVGPIRK